MLLNEKYLKKVGSIASHVTDKNAMVCAVPGTNLSVLDAILEANLLTMYTDGSLVEAPKNAYVPAKYSLATVSDVDPSEEVSKTIIEQAVKEIKTKVNYIRTVVRPAITDCVEEIKEQYDSKLAKELASRSLNIEVIAVPEVLSYPDFEESIDSSPAPSEARIKSGTIKLDKVDPSVIKNAVSNTAIPNIPAELLENWVEKTDNVYLSEILDTYFVEIGPGSPEYNELRHHISVDIGKLLVDIYIIAHGILANPPEVYKVSEKIYKTVLIETIGYVKAILRVVRNIARSYTTAKTLIINTTDTKVNVYGPVLEEYYSTKLIDGSTPTADAILGSAVSKNLHRNMNNIIDNHDDLVKTWNRYVSVWTTQTKMRFKRQLSLIVESVLVEQARTSASDWELASREEAMFDIVKDGYPKLREKLSDIDVDEFMFELTEEVGELVIAYRFPYTEADCFFEEMEELAEHYEDMDVEDIGSLATMRYVVKHLMKRVSISR